MVAAGVPVAVGRSGWSTRLGPSGPFPLVSPADSILEPGGPAPGGDQLDGTVAMATMGWASAMFPVEP